MWTLRELWALCLTLGLPAVASAEPPRAVDGCFADHPITVVMPYFHDRGSEGGADPELVGAQLFTPAERGLTAEWLHRELHRTRRPLGRSWRELACMRRSEKNDSLASNRGSPAA